MNKQSEAWNTYSFVSFGAAFIMLIGGIWVLPADFWIKGYLSMGTIFLTGSTVSLTKALRDKHEAERLTNKIEEAKTDKILREFEQVA